jgi:general secretion pathway protein E
MRGSGCPVCRGTGYKGRRAIAETLAMTDELRDLLSNRASIRQLREAGQRAGLRTLRTAAVDLALAGHTTLEEINRVTTVDH